jgi:hypothetical protein
VNHGRGAARKQIEDAFAEQGISELLPPAPDIRAEAWSAAQSRQARAPVVEREVMQKPSPTLGV